MSADTPHILYIDDDAGLRRLAALALSRRGFQVSLAESGPEGVTLVGQGHFDLIAIDHYMPRQDGLTTLAQLQELPNCPPVVYVTGSEETQIAVAALKSGAVDYVVKTAGEDFFDLLANAFRQALEQIGLRRAKEAAEAELRASNARLETLLREVNHRVANSLQLVTAFVQMQAAVLTDPTAKSALKETQQRVQAIAQVHRRLYASGDVHFVSMDDYLRALVAELGQTWSTDAAPRALTLRADPIMLKSERAVSLGVIVNELVTNACKYAYPADRAGEVRIELAGDEGGCFRLSVEDDGVGLPPDGSILGTGLGTKLIRAMAASLKAEIAFEPRQQGVRAVVTGTI